MRKLVASFFLSLDGVYEGPGPADNFKYAGWAMRFWNEEVDACSSAGMAAADMMLLGRKTFQAFETFFGSSTDTEGDAAVMNAFKRYVVSTTLTEVI